MSDVSSDVLHEDDGAHEVPDTEANLADEHSEVPLEVDPVDWAESDPARAIEPDDEVRD